MKYLLLAVLAWAAWRWLSRPPRVPADVAAAARLLGVPASADAGTIRDAHRARVAAVHPDRGGSAAETGALNAARDLLLARTR